MANVPSHWVDRYMAPQQGTEDTATVDNTSALVPLDITPWGQLSESGRRRQRNSLQTWSTEMEAVIRAFEGLPPEQKAWLESQEWENLPTDWRQMIANYEYALQLLPQVQTAVKEADMLTPPPATPRVSQGGTTDFGYGLYGFQSPVTPSPVAQATGEFGWAPGSQAAASGDDQWAVGDLDTGVSLSGSPDSGLDAGMGAVENPLASAGAGTVVDENGVSWTPEQIAEYGRNVLQGQGLDVERAQLENEQLRQELEGTGLSPFEAAVEQLSLYKQLQQLQAYDPVKEAQQAQEDRDRAYQSQQYSQWLQRKQLENSIGSNVAQLQQEAWRHITQNALPAGTGYVPGFGPDSRTAQYLGFGGIPTTNVNTPDTAAAYQWAQKYLGGQ